MRVAIAKALALLPLAPYVKGVPEKWPVASGQEANYNFFKVRVVMK